MSVRTNRIKVLPTCNLRKYLRDVLADAEFGNTAVEFSLALLIVGS